GSVGYVCPSSYTSCSNGACSSAPAVLLPGAVAVSEHSKLTSTVE
ncbi:unnamed protein product, partial [Rotaria magnacalcarata]